jgi:hypothetical protein
MPPAILRSKDATEHLIAFTILTGARDGATASIKLKHVDIDQGLLDQDARQVKTKFAKSFATWFFPVGDDIGKIVADWISYLRQNKLWGRRSPFPGDKNRRRKQSPFRGRWPRPQTLEQRRAHSEDFQIGFCGGGPALL